MLGTEIAISFENAIIMVALKSPQLDLILDVTKDVITPHFRSVWKADDKSDCKLNVCPPFCPRGASRLPRD
jgi:hypothetical protein